MSRYCVGHNTGLIKVDQICFCFCSRFVGWGTWPCWTTLPSYCLELNRIPCNALDGDSTQILVLVLVLTKTLRHHQAELLPPIHDVKNAETQRMPACLSVCRVVYPKRVVAWLRLINTVNHDYCDSIHTCLVVGGGVVFLLILYHWFRSWLDGNCLVGFGL